MRVFKIYDPKTGLYKNRGSRNDWSKKGSVWNGIGPLKLHLRLEKDLWDRKHQGKDGTDYDYESHWEVHEFELVQEHRGHSKVGDFLKQHPTKKN